MAFLKKKLKMGAGASNEGRPNTAGGAGAAGAEDPSAPPTPDSRLPFANYRELYTMKNFWKAVKRKEGPCSKQMFYKFVNVKKYSFFLLCNFVYTPYSLINKNS